MSEQRIVCAAVKVDGVVFCGVRHGCPLMRVQMEAAGVTTWLGGDNQGFVDNNYKYLTRAEAWKVAEAAGQIIDPKAYCKGVLFSENLY